MWLVYFLHRLHSRPTIFARFSSLSIFHSAITAAEIPSICIIVEKKPCPLWTSGWIPTASPREPAISTYCYFQQKRQASVAAAPVTVPRFQPMYWLMQQIFARRMSSSCKNGFPNRSWPSSSFLVWVSSGMNVWDLCLVSLQFAIVSAAIRRQNISREQVTVTICRRCNNHYSTTSTTIATRTCCDNSGSKVLQLGSCRIRPDKAYVSWCYPSLKWCVLLWKFANVERIQTLVVALVLPGVDRSVDRPTPSSVWRQPKNAPKLQSDC